MATGPYKRITIDIRLDPQEHTAKVDYEKIKLAAVKMVNRLLKNPSATVGCNFRWYMKTKKGTWK